MHWQEIKNKIKVKKKSFTNSWQSVFLSLHYFPERVQPLAVCIQLQFCSNTDFKKRVNTEVSTQKEHVLQSMSSRPHGWLVPCRGQALGGDSLACWEKIKMLCLNTPKLKGGTVQLNILHSWCHANGKREEKEVDRRNIMKLLYLVCQGSWVVVVGRLALMSIKGVSGATAQSLATVVYRAVGSRAAVHDDLPGLI